MTIWYEEVTEKCGHIVIASNVRPATYDEIKDAERLHAQGNCPHTIVKDTPSWMYDLRECVTCGQGLGLI